MSDTILVFGKSGQVARELQRHADVVAVGRDTADLSTPGTAAKAIKDHSPKLVINAAAYTAVDQAEQQDALAFQINADAVGEMASACARMHIPLVHISTDYVFDGSGTTPWAPGDPPAPLGVYGRSKLAGEDAIRAAGGTYAILRTSWVISAHGNNFLKTMLRLGMERDEIRVVSDQIGGPTGAADIAAACLSIGLQLQHNVEKTGTYHFAGHPNTSWADFARHIFKQAQLPCTVIDIPSSAYPTPTKRPLNSRMDCSTTQAQFEILRPNWHHTITGILQDLTK